jgi:hypothetical protein
MRDRCINTKRICEESAWELFTVHYKNQAYLIHPVGVENPQSTKLASSSLLSNRPLVPLELELSDTLVLGLTIDNTLGHRPLPATTPHTDTVNNISLKTNNKC